jgi:hypothetical protein
MARHAWKGKRVPLPGRPVARHRRMTAWERLVVVAATWFALRFAQVR